MEKFVCKTQPVLAVMLDCAGEGRKGDAHRAPEQRKCFSFVLFIFSLRTRAICRSHLQTLSLCVCLCLAHQPSEREEAQRGRATHRHIEKKTKTN